MKSNGWFFALYLVFVLHWSCANAQIPLSDLHFINTATGLSHNTNEYVVKDRSGFVWISSVEGLNRFDGRKVRSFRNTDAQSQRMLGNIIQSSFFEDTQKHLWFSTESGINRYDPRTETFMGFAIHDSLLDKNGAHRAIFLEKKRFLWTYADRSLYKFDIQTHQTTRVSDFDGIYYAADTTPDGTLKRLVVCHWVMRKGIDIYEFGHGNHPQKKTYLMDGQGGVVVKSIYVQHPNAIWLATNKGLLLFDPEHPSAVQSFLPNQDLRHLCYLGNGHLAVTVEVQQTILLFDLLKRQVSAPLYTIDQQGKSDLIRGAVTLTVQDGIVWCTTENKGVFYFPLTAGPFFNAAERTVLPASPICDIAQAPNGHLWCATMNDTLYQILPDGTVNVQKSASIGGRIEFSPNGEWQVSTNQFNAQVVPTKYPEQIKAFNLPSFNPNKSMAVENTGCYFACTDGLYYCSFVPFSLKKIPKIAEHISCIRLDEHGQLWVGGNNELRVCSITPNSQEVTVLKSLPIPGTIHDLFPSPQGHLWVASSNGLFKVHTRNWEVTKVPALAHLYAMSVTETPDGQVWIGTTQGLARFQPATGTVDLYTPSDGLRNNTFHSAAALWANGKMYLGGPAGLDAFDPQQIAPVGHAPQMAISDLLVNGRPIPVAKYLIDHTPLTLEYNENTLEIHLAALEFRHPEHNTFQIQLEGLDTGWIDLGKNHIHRYEQLRPGQYQLRVKGANAEGIWQTQPLLLDVVIRPHFTDTWWFRLLVVGFIIGIIAMGLAFYLLFRLREQQLLTEKSQRESDKKFLLLQNEIALRDQRDQIATGIHDDLGTGLSSIRLLSEKTQRQVSDEQVKAALERIATLSTHLDDNRRSLSWATDPDMDTLDSWVAKIRYEVSQAFESSEIALQLRIADIPEGRFLDGTSRLHLLRAVKEAINNLLRHSKASTAVISIEIEAETLLKVSIEDNGIGFDPATLYKKGKGLNGIVRHMELIGGTAAWSPIPTGGMRLLLAAPLP